MREIKFRASYKGQEYNVATRLPSRDNTGWKGWYKRQGYIIRLVTEHPFADKRGYVPEHRLVVESVLGRFLESCERIHHRDQDRGNNEYSNLELYGGQDIHSLNHLVGKRNKHGQFVAQEPIFSDIKFRLYNKNTNTTYIYTLATLIGTTFRRGQFEFRGRFTGLKDKNGKEIYEGDIFKILLEPEEINAVTFESGCWMLNEHGLDLIDWYGNGVVIGNIYENPELLEGKK